MQSLSAEKNTRFSASCLLPFGSMGAPPLAGALNPNGSINSRGSFCALLNGALPAQDAAFTELFEAWTVNLTDIGASQAAVNNVKGEWYEWLIAICAWNYRVNQNPGSHITLKLPNIAQFEVSRLYQPPLYTLIADLRQKVEEAAHVSLVTSNPDFVLLRHGEGDVPQGLLEPIAGVDEGCLQSFIRHTSSSSITAVSNKSRDTRLLKHLSVQIDASKCRMREA